jgi:hypothetical protein
MNYLVRLVTPKVNRHHLYCPEDWKFQEQSSSQARIFHSYTYHGKSQERSCHVQRVLILISVIMGPPQFNMGINYPLGYVRVTDMNIHCAYFILNINFLLKIMFVQLQMQSVHITTDVVSSNLDQGEVFNNMG